MGKAKAQTEPLEARLAELEELVADLALRLTVAERYLPHRPGDREWRRSLGAALEAAAERADHGREPGIDPRLAALALRQRLALLPDLCADDYTWRVERASFNLLYNGRLSLRVEPESEAAYHAFFDAIRARNLEALRRLVDKWAQ